MKGHSHLSSVTIRLPLSTHKQTQNTSATHTTSHGTQPQENAFLTHTLSKTKKFMPFQIYFTLLWYNTKHCEEQAF